MILVPLLAVSDQRETTDVSPVVHGSGVQIPHGAATVSEESVFIACRSDEVAEAGRHCAVRHGKTRTPAHGGPRACRDHHSQVRILTSGPSLPFAT